MGRHRTQAYIASKDQGVQRSGRLILLRPERVADEIINGALDRGVIMPALGLQESLCD
jgi:hypothetical protein